MVAAIPLPAFPGVQDTIRLIPELILGAGFLLLMILDLLVPARRRGVLAAVTTVVLAMTLASVVWAWFDTGRHGYAYYGSFAYDRFAFFLDGIILTSAILVVIISPGYLNRRGLHHGEYYALIVGASVGMMFLAGANSLMVIFLGIELLSISLC